MTNEEAKKQLKQLKAFTGYDKLHEALDMAIDDGRHHENCHYSMLAPSEHHIGIDKSHFT